MKEIGEIARLNVDHLPQWMYENIACTDQRKELIDIIRKLPLDKSVPIMMQIILNASVAEIAEYLNVSKQAVYKKNKLTLTILKPYIDI